MVDAGTEVSLFRISIFDSGVELVVAEGGCDAGVCPLDSSSINTGRGILDGISIFPLLLIFNGIDKYQEFCLELFADAESGGNLNEGTSWKV